VVVLGDERDIVSLVLERHGFDSLNPVQEAAVSAGLLEGKNVVVASPTASGKTLIAETAMLMALATGRKAIYTAPLRALASEHYREFAELYPEYKAALLTGDLDSADSWAARYDVIFTTYEKLDSAIRHGAPWVSSAAVLVVDEVHEIDSDRGPTLEMVLTRFLLRGSAQIVALSATIPNAHELAGWMGAELVTSEWRPVTLKEGVYFDKQILFSDGEERRVSSSLSDDVLALVDDTLSKGKQILIFAPTRKSAESLARRLRSVVSKYVSSRRKLESLARHVLEALEQPTAQCKELAEDVRHGVAFHHAGLVSKQRTLVEDAFRRGDILALTATPTLAAGVNLPAFRVLVYSVARYTGSGYEPIPVRDYKQMAGRAGRPKYDDHGEALLYARDASKALEFMDHYIMGTPENVYSRLGAEPALRFHMLSLVATAPSLSRERVREFFSRTLYGYQYGDLDALLARVDAVLLWLAGEGFVEDRGDSVSATKLGRRVAQLYIDPASAVTLLEFIRHPRFGSIPFLYMLTLTTEMRPLPSVSSREEERLWNVAAELRDELPVDFDSWDFDDFRFLNRLKLTLILEDWINERTEDEILSEYDVSPGILRVYVSNAEWMAYSMAELAKLLDVGRVWRFASRMQERIHYGVREDLLELVRLKGIGRVRARKLYNAGFRSVKDLQRADPAAVAEVLGPKLARALLEQVGVKISQEDRERMRRASLRDQTTLDMFVG